MRRLVPLALVLAACDSGNVAGGGGGGATVVLSGVVEKGPVASGTVEAAPLDARFRAGTARSTETEGVLGRYDLRVPAAKAWLLRARGAAYRESTGAVGGEVELEGIHVSTGASVEKARVNVVTHLTRRRIERLVAEGRTPADAARKAAIELHLALGIGVPHFAPELPASARTMLGGDDAERAYLLAVSAVLDETAGPDDGTLPALLSRIAVDLADDGLLDEALQARILETQRTVDGTAVVERLRAYLDAAGERTTVIPDIHRILDWDEDGIPNRDDPLRVEVERLRIVRTGVALPDEVVGEPGAVSGGCPPITLTFLDAGDAPVGTAIADGRGGLAPAPVGTADDAFGRLRVRAADRCGKTTEPAEIRDGQDVEPPAVGVAFLRIERHPVGEPDVVIGLPGAFSDEGTGMAEVWLYSRNGAESGPVTLEPDGSFRVTWNDPDRSWPRVFVEAVDRAGNRSERIEILDGAAVTPPTADASRARIERRPLGQRDRVAVDGGAFAMGTCWPAEVRFHDGETTVATAPVRADGGTDAVEVGEGDESPARLWLVPVDKCGVEGEPVEILDGADLDPPVVDAAQVTLTLEPGRAPVVEGRPGAVLDAVSPVREVLVLDAGCSPSVARPAAVFADGGFSKVEALSDPARRPWACVQAVDKAGLRSEPVPSRRVRATVDPRDVDAAPRPSVTTFAWAGRVDPRTHAPGWGPFATNRLGPADRDALGVAYDLVVEWEAAPAPVHPPGAIEWVSTELSRTPDRVAAALDERRWTTVAIRDRVGDGARFATVEQDAGGWRLGPPGPPVRDGMGLGWDGNRRRVVAVGGTEPPGGDVWEYDGVVWEDVTGTGGPGPSAWARLAWDSNRSKLVLVAATSAGAPLSLWERDAAGWQLRNVAGGPSHRTDFDVAFDPFRGQVVLFGGRSASGTPLAETWFWNGTSWSQGPAPSGMTPSLPVALAYDAGSLGTLLVAPQSAPWRTWAFHLSNWQSRSNAPGPGSAPLAMAPDAASGSPLLFHADGSGWTASEWDPTGNRWTGRLRHPASAPDATIAWDPYESQVALLRPEGTGGVSRWRMARGVWEPAETLPLAAPVTLVADTHRGRRLLFAGAQARILDEAGLPATVTIARPPGATAADRPVYDASHGRILLVTATGTWAFGDGWTRLLEEGHPGQLVFDPLRGTVVSYDRTAGATWELEGRTWRRRTASAPCVGGRVAFDPASRRLFKTPGTDALGRACAARCVLDGEPAAWTCDTAASALDQEAAIGPDLVRGGLVALEPDGTMARTEGTPATHPALSASLKAPEGAVLQSGTVRVRAGGQGWVEGEAVGGVELHAWDPPARTWRKLDDTAAPASELRDAEGVLEPGLLDDGRLWLLVTPRGVPSPAGPSTLRADRVEVTLEFLLP